MDGVPTGKGVTVVYRIHRLGAASRGERLWNAGYARARDASGRSLDGVVPKLDHVPLLQTHEQGDACGRYTKNEDEPKQSHPRGFTVAKTTH